MVSSQVRVHDCFDVLAGESKPLKCNCPKRVSPEEAQELVESGKAKLLNRRSIALLGVRNPAARAANPEVFAANETDHEFVQQFRRLVPKSKLSESDVLDGIKNLEKFNGSDAYPAARRLSEHYWNTALVNRKLSMSRGEFLTDAPHGRGKPISVGIDSDKISKLRAQYDKEGSGRVKAANFRKGEFNDGIISSPGSEPDKFSSENLRVNRHDLPCDPNQDVLDDHFAWEMDQIVATFLSLQNKGYSEERIMAEISQHVVQVFSKKAVTLICRVCGTHTEGVLQLPPDVPAQDKQPFTCKKCNGRLMDGGRRTSPRKAHVPKEEAKAA